MELWVLEEVPLPELDPSDPPAIEGNVASEAPVGCETVKVDEETTETTGVKVSDLPVCAEEMGNVLDGNVLDGNVLDGSVFEAAELAS